jgi:hypothetical protein
MLVFLTGSTVVLLLHAWIRGGLMMCAFSLMQYWTQSTDEKPENFNIL